MDNYFEKFDNYTTLGAIKMFQNNKNFHITDVIFRPPIDFIKKYFLKLGFLDGFEGFIWAMLGNFSTFVKYLKFYNLKKKKNG